MLVDAELLEAQTLRPQRTEIWPKADPLPEHLDVAPIYYHAEETIYSPSTRSFHLSRGSFLSFRTFMNVFPYKKWMLLTDNKDLYVRIEYEGGPFEIAVVGEGGPTRRLLGSAHLGASKSLKRASIRLEAGHNDVDVAYVEIRSHDSGAIFDVSFECASINVRPLELAVVVVTYNREDDLRNLCNALEGLRNFEVGFRVIIVNNGEKLNFKPVGDEFSVIDCPNLGGAGGFTRGLIAAQEQGDITHVMFIDDDALCTPASIVRAAIFCASATDEKTAISGGMNYSHAPQVQYELGAKIESYGVKSVNMNSDLAIFDNVISNERVNHVDYGPWWFFVFPLSQVRTLPFPFFVRGDDIAFSLQNVFSLVSLPGVCAWQPSFEFKINAGTEYLVHRSFLMVPLLCTSNLWSASDIIAGFTAQLDCELRSYRYPIAEALLAAINDVAGPSAFWLDEANTLGRLGELRALEAETSRRWNLRARTVRRIKKPSRATRLFGRVLQKVGLFRFVKYRGAVRIPFLSPQPWMAFLRKGIIYCSPDGSVEMKCRHDAAWDQDIRLRAGPLVDSYRRQFDSLRQQYANSEGLQGRAVWNDKFGKAKRGPSVI